MALTRAQYMDPPGGPGSIGAIREGSYITITADGVISWPGAPATTVSISPVSGISASNVQEAISQLEAQIQSLSGSTILAGLYNANLGVLSYATAAGSSAGFSVGQNLPAPSPAIDNYYVIVTIGGNIGPSSSQPSSPGDWWICESNGPQSVWFLIAFDDRYIPAQNVLVSTIPGIPLASNAQEALTQLEAQTNDRVQKAVNSGSGTGVSLNVSAAQPVYEGTTLTLNVDPASLSGAGTVQLTNSVAGQSESLAITQKAGNDLSNRIDQLSGQQVLAGTYNCLTGTLVYVTPSAQGKGFVVGSNCPNPSVSIDNYYVIVVTGGSQSPPGLAPPANPYKPGDWFICEGTTSSVWVPIAFDNTTTSAANVSLNPAVNGRTNVQDSNQDLNARLIQCVSNLVSDVGLSISVRSSTSDGRTLVANLNPSNPSNLGGVIVPGGNGLRVDGSGVLDLTAATSIQIGGVKIGKGITVDQTGLITVNPPRVIDQISFNGTSSSFALTTAGAPLTNPLPSDLLIFVGGVAQPPNSYTLSNNLITFSEIPPAGATFYGILLYS